MKLKSVWIDDGTFEIVAGMLHRQGKITGSGEPAWKAQPCILADYRMPSDYRFEVFTGAGGVFTNTTDLMKAGDCSGTVERNVL